MTSTRDSPPENVKVELDILLKQSKDEGKFLIHQMLKMSVSLIHQNLKNSMCFCLRRRFLRWRLS